jgi:hypothetical protein
MSESNNMRPAEKDFGVHLITDEQEGMETITMAIMPYTALYMIMMIANAGINHENG